MNIEQFLSMIGAISILCLGVWLFSKLLLKAGFDEFFRLQKQKEKTR